MGENQIHELRKPLDWRFYVRVAIRFALVVGGIFQLSPGQPDLQHVVDLMKEQRWALPLVAIAWLVIEITVAVILRELEWQRESRRSDSRLRRDSEKRAEVKRRRNQRLRQRR